MKPDGVFTLFQRPEVVLLCMTLVIYGYFYQAGGWNANSRFALVRAIVEQGSFSIDAYHSATGDKSFLKGHYYTGKAPGVSLLGTLPYIIIYTVSGNPVPGERQIALASWWVTLFTASLPVSIAVVILYRLLTFMEIAWRTAAALALAFGLATPVFPYATLYYGYGLAVALLLGAFTLLIRMRHTGKAAPWSLAGTGALSGLSVVADYTTVLAAAVLGFYSLTFLRTWKQGAWLLAGAGFPAILLMAYNTAAFGGPLHLSYQYSIWKEMRTGFAFGIGTIDWTAVYHLLFSSYRGLFYSSPWLLLALPGALLMFFQKRFLPEAAVCLAVFIAFVWMAASFVWWHGAWSVVPRFLLPAVPFLAVATAGLFLPVGKGGIPEKFRPLGFPGLAVAGFYSFFMMLVCTAVKPEIPQAISTPFQTVLFPAFFDGVLGFNRQSITMYLPDNGGPPAAWNLGQLLGLQGLWSLVPLAMYIPAMLYLLMKATRCPSG